MESMQFSFMDDLEGRIECAVTKFEDKPELGEKVDMLEGKAFI